MDDLISRQAAIDALGDEPEVWSEKDEYEQGLNNQWHYDVNALKAVPSAERHGRYEQHDDPLYAKGGYWECSCCKWRISNLIFIEDVNYCPNCGAKMDGEQNE